MDWNPSFTNWEHLPPLLLPDPLQQDLFCPWRTSGTQWMSGISEKGQVELQAVMWDLTSCNSLERCSGTCIKDQGCEKNWRRHRKAARGTAMEKQTHGAKMWCFESIKSVRWEEEEYSTRYHHMWGELSRWGKSSHGVHHPCPLTGGDSHASKLSTQYRKCCYLSILNVW